MDMDVDIICYDYICVFIYQCNFIYCYIKLCCIYINGNNDSRIYLDS